jgi:hypothetical protein
MDEKVDAKSYGVLVGKALMAETICSYLDMRAHHSWPSSQWPMAYEVLSQIAKELRENFREPLDEALRRGWW